MPDERKTYTLDITMFATVEVKATSQREAERMVRALHGKAVVLGTWRDGQPILTTIDIDDIHNISPED